MTSVPVNWKAGPFASNVTSLPSAASGVVTGFFGSPRTAAAIAPSCPPNERFSGFASVLTGAGASICKSASKAEAERRGAGVGSGAATSRSASRAEAERRTGGRFSSAITGRGSSAFSSSTACTFGSIAPGNGTSTAFTGISAGCSGAMSRLTSPVGGGPLNDSARPSSICSRASASASISAANEASKALALRLLKGRGRIGLPKCFALAPGRFAPPEPPP